MISTGLDRFSDREYRKFRGVRLGILCHQASVDRNLVHISDLLMTKKLDVRLFFGPQHGIRGEKQDNMVESEDFADPKTGIPIISLYAKTREPKRELLEQIDCLIVDLQDIGCRIYTFMYTLANCMRIAKQAGCKVLVLDRPNPIGAEIVDGNVLNSSFTSFVGQFPISTQHGMTLGELATLFNDHFGIGCDLEVHEVKGWRRNITADSWKRDWVTPSPNIPTLSSAALFPATVLFEGTNISEGRGTTKPFEWIGAPFIDPEKLAAHMNKKKLPGLHFRPIYFQPTYQKHKDVICGGVQLHITDKNRIRPVRAGIELLYSVRELFGKALEWKPPPYEYELENLPIDLIAGTDKLRHTIDNQAGLKTFFEQVAAETLEFKKLRRHYLVY